MWYKYGASERKQLSFHVKSGCEPGTLGCEPGTLILIAARFSACIDWGRGFPRFSVCTWGVWFYRRRGFVWFSDSTEFFFAYHNVPIQGGLGQGRWQSARQQKVGNGDCSIGSDMIGTFSGEQIFWKQNSSQNAIGVSLKISSEESLQNWSVFLTWPDEFSFNPMTQCCWWPVHIIGSNPEWGNGGQLPASTKHQSFIVHCILDVLLSLRS